MPHDSDPSHPHSLLPPDPALRVQALETILREKGLIDPDALAAIISTYENDIGPQNGARVVAKAWCDDGFRARLLADPMPLLQDLGFYGRQGEHMVIVENTAALHNLVVCTLCSCYPWPLLGIPPAWYKSDAYRARLVFHCPIARRFGSGIQPLKSAILYCRCARRKPRIWTRWPCAIGSVGIA